MVIPVAPTSLLTNQLIEGNINPSSRRITNHTVNLVNDLVLKISDGTKADVVIDNFVKLFLPIDISDNLRTSLLDSLLDGTDLTDWSVYYDESEARVRGIVKAILLLPEYQLT